jgi:hypothetical protein
MTKGWIPAACLAVLLFGVTSPLQAAHDEPVPQRCTAQVNARLGEVIERQIRHGVDNVMVCGVTVSSSRHQRARRHGGHEILPLRVKFPDGSERLVEVVTNDDLDGVVTARSGVEVFALGQAFLPGHGHFAAGIHDVHCSTHRGADNGWVVIDGAKHPASCHL